jgi:hypothetical protein
MNRRILLLLGLLVLPSSARAGDADFDKRFWTLFGFPLNDTSLAEVGGRLGSAPTFDVPEGHHESAICYRTTDESIVVVFSTGELGGGWQLIGVTLELASLHKYPCKAPLLPLSPTLPLGLRPGMKENEFLKTAGVSFKRTDSSTLYHCSDYKRAISASEAEKRYEDKDIARIILDRGGMDVRQCIEAALSKRSVVAIGVWKQETF